MAVGMPSFQQQHARPCASDKPRRHHAPRGTAADDDVVVTLNHDLALSITCLRRHHAALIGFQPEGGGHQGAGVVGLRAV